VLPKHQGQVELRGVLRERDHVETEVGPLHARQGDVLQRQRGLDQRGLAEVALEPQVVHQLLKWKLLVRKRLQASPFHPPEQLRETWAAPQVSPQHEQVDEEANQPLELDQRPVRHRRADQQVLLSAEASQQHAVGRQHRHEQGCATFVAELAETADAGGRELPGQGGAPRFEHRGPGAIGRQVEARRRARQLPPPVLDLALQALAPELLPLPGRIVPILDRQSR